VSFRPLVRQIVPEHGILVGVRVVLQVVAEAARVEVLSFCRVQETGLSLLRVELRALVRRSPHRPELCHLDLVVEGVRVPGGGTGRGHGARVGRVAVQLYGGVVAAQVQRGQRRGHGCRGMVRSDLLVCLDGFWRGRLDRHNDRL